MSTIEQLIASMTKSSAAPVSLSDLISECVVRNSDRSISEVRSVTNRQGLVPTSDFFDNARTSSDTKNYKVVAPGMFVYNPSRINVGSISWLNEASPVIVSPMYVVFALDQSRVLPEYLQLFLSSAGGKQQIEARTEIGARFRLPYESLARIKMPLPPLEAQRIVVELLGRFTALVSELERESVARSLQLDHYRNLLISRCAESARWSTLSEVANVKVGQAPPLEIVDASGPYSFVNAGTSESGRVLEMNTPGDAVTIPSRGQGGVGIVGFQTQDFWCGPLCYRITSSTDSLDTRFLYHYLKSIQPSIRALQQIAGTPALNRKELVLVKVPVPTFSEQRRVVALLDKFDQLLNDNRVGIPAELRARRNQHEFYLDRLLSAEVAS